MQEEEISFENYDPSFPDQPVVDQYLPIWANLPSFRHKVAFVWAKDTAGGISWASVSYTELNNAVEAIAVELRCSLNRGDVLLVLCSPGLRLVKLIFACQRAGLVAVPLIPPDPPAASHHLLRAVSQARPQAAVADRQFISAVTGPASAGHERLRKIRWLSVEQLDDGIHSAMAPSTGGEYSGCRAGDNYLVQYTSGATGIPKPVLVAAGAAAHNVRAARRAYDLQPSSVIVSWLPQYHDCGLMFLLLTVVAGATCVLAAPTAFLRRPRLWLELITAFRATCTPVPAFALPLTVKRGRIEHGMLPLELGSLRNLILVNEPVYKSPVDEFIDAFAAAGIDPSSVAPSYGLAENCTFVSTSWPREDEARRRRTRYTNLPPCNKLLPSAMLGPSSSSTGEGEADITIVVVNEETCEPVADDEEGEIWVSSASNATGYLGHPSLTREVFRCRLLGRAGRCFVRTGDRGIIAGAERYLYVTGRSSDLITTDADKQLRIHPHYIETAAYRSSPKHLRGGCIVAFGGDSTAPTLVVIAELQTKKQPEMEQGAEFYKNTCSEIREGVRKEEGSRVRRVVLVESGSIPKTTSGKPRRWLAKHKLEDGSLRVVFEQNFEEEEEGGNGEAIKRMLLSLL